MRQVTLRVLLLNVLYRTVPHNFVILGLERGPLRSVPSSCVPRHFNHVKGLLFGSCLVGEELWNLLFLKFGRMLVSVLPLNWTKSWRWLLRSNLVHSTQSQLLLIENRILNCCDVLRIDLVVSQVIHLRINILKFTYRRESCLRAKWLPL